MDLAALPAARLALPASSDHWFISGTDMLTGRVRLQKASRNGGKQQHRYCRQNRRHRGQLGHTQEVWIPLRTRAGPNVHDQRMPEGIELSELFGQPRKRTEDAAQSAR